MTQTNCPNCGAPIVGHKCAYCGTVFDSERVNKKPIDHRQQYLNKMYIMGRVTREQYIALCDAHAVGLDEYVELNIEWDLCHSNDRMLKIANNVLDQLAEYKNRDPVFLSDVRAVEFDPRTEGWKLYI